MGAFHFGWAGSQKSSDISQFFAGELKLLMRQTLCLQYDLISNHFLDFEGNVYIGAQPVCDDGFGSEEARVACRSSFQLSNYSLSVGFHNLLALLICNIS